MIENSASLGFIRSGKPLSAAEMKEYGTKVLEAREFARRFLEHKNCLTPLSAVNRYQNTDVYRIEALRMAKVVTEVLQVANDCKKLKLLEGIIWSRNGDKMVEYMVRLEFLHRKMSLIGAQTRWSRRKI